MGNLREVFRDSRFTLAYLAVDYLIDLAGLGLLVGAYLRAKTIEGPLRVSDFSSLLEISFGMAAATFAFNVSPGLLQRLRALGSYSESKSRHAELRKLAKRRYRVLSGVYVVQGLLAIFGSLLSVYWLYEAGLAPNTYTLDPMVLTMHIAIQCLLGPLLYFRMHYRLSRAIPMLENYEEIWAKKGG